MVSEISVGGQLAILPLVKQKHHGQQMEYRKAADFMVAWKQGGATEKIHPLETDHQCSASSHRPCSPYGAFSYGIISRLLHL